MKRYRILKPVVLGFNTPQEQVDMFIEPGESTLEADGSTIWLVQKDKRYESITIASAIRIWLANGTIEELPGA